jgi:hypothetical protein
MNEHQCEFLSTDISVFIGGSNLWKAVCTCGHSVYTQDRIKPILISEYLFLTTSRDYMEPDKAKLLWQELRELTTPNLGDN